MSKVWQQHYPAGVPTEINEKQYHTITELLDKTCSKYKDKTAFINMGAKLSFAELDELSDDFAGFLQSRGLQKGDRIALQMPNLLQYPIALFGALKAGLIVVNTNPLYTAREMRHQFKDSGAKAIVILSNFASMLDEVIGDTDIETVVVTQIGDQLGWPKSLLVNFVVKYVKKMVPNYKLPNAFSFYEALDTGKSHGLKPVTVESEDLAFLQYTGGTTGVSKGAMLTHKNIVSNMLQTQEWMKPKLVEGEEIIVTALPLYHIFALTVNCLSIFSYGGTNLIITNPKDIPTFIKTLKKQKFTTFSGVNTLFNALANHPDFQAIDFSALKISVGGGMALQRPVAELWQKVTGSKVIEGYGLTEASPLVSCNPIDGTDRVGTIGLPVPSTDIKFVDEDGNEVADGEPGEICVRGPQVMKGYWQRQDETDKIMLQGGWLKTGDIGVIDKDGFVKIVDRKKDMILVSGFNVYPNEIEEVVASHDKVLEAAAIGIPDDHSGEAVKIFVVAKDSSLKKEDLEAFCKDQLVGYKRPRHIEFREELPKTNVGKILRRALREPSTDSK